MTSLNLVHRYGRRIHRKGFTGITTILSSAAMIGTLGVSIDIGRLYITKNESQAFADAAALAAVLEMDGTQAGLTRARAAVSASPNKWNMGRTAFANPTVEFAQAQAGPWSQTPADAAGYRYARVTARANLPIFFMPVVNGPSGSWVGASSAAGQVAKNSFSEGLFPFTPLAHSTTGPHFGLTPGQRYTMRWASNPRVNHNTCAGDNHNTWINQAEAGGGSERGYYQETSSSIIRQAIEQDYMFYAVEIGGQINMTGGAKNTQSDSLQHRAEQDTDTTATTYATYAGNGRRVVGMPINTYSPDYTVVGYGAFFLLPAATYNATGNEPFCAEYIGPWVQGANNRGGAASGAYVVRLVE